MKKLLLSLFGIITLGLINFGICDTVDSLIDIIQSNSSVSLSPNGFSNLYHVSDSTQLGTYCVKIKSFSNVNRIQLGYSSNGTTFDLGTQYVDIWEGDIPNITCFYSYYGYISIGNSSSSSVSNISYDLFRLDDLLAEALPVMTSLECQSNYSLIPISSVNQSYCVNNGLCPSNGDDCPVCPGSGDNWSALYVNDIQHLGKPIINITIPDYISWDYTTNENEFNLYCGSGYDQDYIDSIISINSYRPTSEDFTNVFVSGLTLVFPYIVILLFIVFVRKLIRRIFK